MPYVVRAILLDLDGTMVDTAPEIARAANHMLAALGLATLPTATIADFIGEGALALITKCLQFVVKSAPDAAMLAQAKTLFFEHYAIIVTESQPYIGVLTSVKKMHQRGFQLACVTNKPRAFTLPLLEKIGLAPYFHQVVCGDCLPQKKPDAAPLLHACAVLGVTVQDAVMVGDSRTDILAARNAKCPILVVKNGYTQGKPIEAEEADGLIEHFAAIEQQVLLKT